MEERFTLSLTDPKTDEIISLDQIETEIKARASIVVENIIAIGHMLIEVKGRMERGQFTDWLLDRVSFSQSSANNFMRIAREVPYTSALVSLPYTKVLAMLDVPADEREQFMADNDVESLSTRELQKVIKERDAAKEEAERQRLAAERSAGFADQYMEKYYDTQEKLNVAQSQLQNLPPPETVEIPVEVVPPDYEEIKVSLAAERQRADAAEKYAAQVDAAYNQERQKAQRAQMQQLDESGALADPYSPKELGKAVQSFMGAMGILPNMDAYFATIAPERLQEYIPMIDTLEAWVKGARAITMRDGLHILDTHAVVE